MLFKYSGKYVNIYFNMKITFSWDRSSVAYRATENLSRSFFNHRCVNTSLGGVACWTLNATLCIGGCVLVYLRGLTENNAGYS